MIAEFANLIIILLGFAALISLFSRDVLFRDAQQKALSQKFETWWKVVEHYNKVKLALALAKKVNKILDLTFGEKHFSKRLIVKCFVISTSLLLITLSITGMTRHLPLAGPPWKAYKESADVILTTTEKLASEDSYAAFLKLTLNSVQPHIETNINPPIANLASNYYLLKRPPEWMSNVVIFHVNSNDWRFSVTTNQTYALEKIEEVGHGTMTLYYGRRFEGESNTVVTTNDPFNLATLTNSFQDLATNLRYFHNKIANYNTSLYASLYSIAFYVAIFMINIFMFIISLAFCRTILREIERSGRTITTFALVFTNGFIVFASAGALILIFTVLAVPLFWLLIPLIYRISSDSLYLTSGFLVSAAIALLISIGASTKVVLFIALLPSFLALCVGFCTILAVKWRNAFHYIFKELLIRFAEKNPFTVLSAIIMAVIGLIEIATKCVHFFGFL